MNKIIILLSFTIGIITATCFAQGTNISEYIKLAEQGDAEAQHNLGLCYINGYGVQQSYEEAAKWFRKAAEQGNASAQYDLGLCYDNGDGVQQS